MQQGTPEWLEFRKSKIGASDAPVIMGVSPWSTPFQLWEQKLGLSEVKINEAMKRGTEMESQAREEFEKITGIKMTPKVITHSEYDWMIASLDGISECSKYIVEIKCPGFKDHEIARNGLIPEKYYPQIQHQLACSNLNMAYYFSFYQNDSCIVEIVRDQKYIDGMIKKELDFFELLKSKIPPELTERDYYQREDDLWNQCALEYQSLLIQSEIIENRKKMVKQRIISLSNGQSSLGGGIRVRKITQKGRVDYDKIPELKLIDLDSYRSDPIEFWKITEC